MSDRMDRLREDEIAYLARIADALERIADLFDYNTPATLHGLLTRPPMEPTDG